MRAIVTRAIILMSLLYDSGLSGVAVRVVMDDVGLFKLGPPRVDNPDISSGPRNRSCTTATGTNFSNR